MSSITPLPSGSGASTSVPDSAAEQPAMLGVAYLIGRLDRVLRQLINEAVAQFGLTVAQYTALSVIRNRGALSNAQLAKKSLISPQAMSEVIKSLEKRQLIEREPDAQHGRIVLIRLTAEAKALLVRCDAVVQSLEATMLGRFNMEQRLTLKDCLRTCLSELTPLIDGV